MSSFFVGKGFVCKFYILTHKTKCIQSYEISHTTSIKALARISHKNRVCYNIFQKKILGLADSELAKVAIFVEESPIFKKLPFWMMAVFTGMRSGEMYALRWQDVNLEARII